MTSIGSGFPDWLQREPVGTFRSKNHGNTLTMGAWGDGPLRRKWFTYGTGQDIHLGKQSTTLGTDVLDQSVIAAARDRAKAADRAVAIVDAADGQLATREVALGRNGRFGGIARRGIPTDRNFVFGNVDNQIRVSDDSVRGFVNAYNGTVIGAAPYESKLANFVFRNTRSGAAFVVLGTMAVTAPLIAGMGRSEDDRGMRVTAGVMAGANALAGATLLAGAIAGRGNPIHSTRWIGMGGAAMLASAAGTAAMLAQDR